MISIEKIMTRDVVTAMTTTNLYDAVRMMADGNITGLPVVDEDEKLVGVVTEKDVMRYLLNTENIEKDVMRYLLNTENIEGTVQDCMTTDVISLNLNDNKLLDVIKVLVEKKFRRVPIECEGKLKGIISRRDIILYIYSCELKDRGVINSSVGGKVFA
ncbi:MAG: CBS domain-containing protein [Planctomycetota bacterium]|jgi:CBS domain-containing protein